MLQEWVYFSLAYPMLYVIITYIDKAVLSVVRYGVMLTVMCIAALIASIIMFVIDGVALSTSIVLASIGLGLTVGWSLYLDLNVLQFTEASKISLLYEMETIFTLVLGTLFLGEILTEVQYIGFFVIIGTSIFIAYYDIIILQKENNETENEEVDDEEPQETMSNTKALIYMLMYTCILAFNFVGFKLIFNEFTSIGVSVPFLAIMAWESLGVFLFGLCLFLSKKKARREFFDQAPNLPIWILLVIFSNEMLFVLAKLCSFYPTIDTAVALVSVIGDIQPIVAVAVGWGLFKLFPKRFPDEETSPKALLVKFVAAIIIAVTIYFIGG